MSAKTLPFLRKAFDLQFSRRTRPAAPHEVPCHNAKQGHFQGLRTLLERSG